MKKAIAILLCLSVLFAVGCDYDAPLSEKQGLPLDASLLGDWEYVTSESRQSKIVISKYSETEYSIGIDNSIFLLGYPVKVANISCVQLIFTDEKYVPASGASKYLVLSYGFSAGDLVIKKLNTNVISTELKSSVQLRKAFLQNKDNSNLFSVFGRFKKLNLSRQEIEEKNRQITALSIKLQELLTAGNAALTAKKYDEAIKLYEQGIALDPEQIGFYDNKAVALRNRGIELFNAGIKLKNTNKNKGFELSLKGYGDVKASIATIDEGIKLYRRLYPSNLKPTNDQAKQEVAYLGQKTESYNALLQMFATEREISEAKIAYDEYLAIESDPVKRKKAQDRLAALPKKSSNDLSELSASIKQSLSKIEENQKQSRMELKNLLIKNFGVEFKKAGSNGTYLVVNQSVEAVEFQKCNFTIKLLIRRAWHSSSGRVTQQLQDFYETYSMSLSDLAPLNFTIKNNVNLFGESAALIVPANTSILTIVTMDGKRSIKVSETSKPVSYTDSVDLYFKSDKVDTSILSYLFLDVSACSF